MNNLLEQILDSIAEYELSRVAMIIEAIEQGRGLSPWELQAVSSRQSPANHSTTFHSEEGNT